MEWMIPGSPLAYRKWLAVMLWKSLTLGRTDLRMDLEVSREIIGISELELHIAIMFV